MSPLSLVIQREYYERVKRKSFIISTIIVPIVMVALMAAPALFMIFSKSEQRTVQVIDNTGVIAQHLESNDDIVFKITGETEETLRADESNETILVIGSNAVKDPSKGIMLLSRGSLSMMTDGFIKSQIEKAIEDVRLSEYNLPDLRQIMDDVKADVNLTTIRIDQEKETETSSELSYILSLLMDMLLYMFIIIYGQMVMTSIIEEKTNRVLEIVVSSVKPFQLMMGKITGVGLVAVTQILIWAVIIGMGVTLTAPFLTPENLGAEASPAMMGAVAQFTEPGFLVTLFVTTLLFFIGGFLFYASIYAAIGSAVSNVQDASQLSSVATMPIIIGIIGSVAIINDPSSTLAFWLSVIPFTSPMTMMARVPYGVPGWEIVVSLVVLFLSFMFMIWLCGKIYRVGIFMYGKKPTIMEIVKWAKYK